MVKNKIVLVTGSNGLLGQSMVRILKRKYYVIGCDITRENFNSINPPHEYKPIDLTKRDAVLRFVSKKRPDIIVNTAAFTNVDKCEEERELCWLTNVRSLEMMAEACDSFAPIFVQISTDYIFDGKAAPYRENDVPKPIGYYGHSKLAAEKVIRSSKLEHIIARTMILYGTGEWVRPNFATWVIEQLKKGNKIKVVNDQIGNPTLVDDLSEAVYRLLHKNEYGVFNICGNEICSRYEFAKKISKVFNLNEKLIEEITTADLKQKALRPMNSSFVLDKLSNVLEWLPGNIEQSLIKLKSQLK